jgi:Spy/CpxP family protein refolding chaperone
MRLHQRWLPFVLSMAALAWGAAARCQESRQLRPEVQLLMHSVSEKLEAAADTLKLTPEQRTKIKSVFDSFKNERTALREQRRTLIESDFKAVSEILSAEQVTAAKAILEDRIDEQPEAEGGVAWLRDDSMRETLLQKLQAAADKLGLTQEQRTKMRERVASSADKYRGQRQARRDLVEAEFKAIAEVLTPEQRQQARNAIEHRVVVAVVTQTLSDRIHGAADKLALTADQKKRIAETREAFEPKFEALADERRELMQSELKAVGEILTPEQREKARDFFRDRVVVMKVDLDPKSITHLKDTVGERLEVAADKLNLTPEQREQIRKQAATSAERYGPQRDQREAARREELNGISPILTPDQREQVKNFIADHSRVQ